MKNLYGSINISKKFNQGNEQINESINYFKLKNRGYGVGIEKQDENNKVEKTKIINITNDEEKIDYILKEILKYELTPSDEGVIQELITRYV